MLASYKLEHVHIQRPTVLNLNKRGSLQVLSPQQVVGSSLPCPSCHNTSTSARWCTGHRSHILPPWPPTSVILAAAILPVPGWATSRKTNVHESAALVLHLELGVVTAAGHSMQYVMVQSVHEFGIMQLHVNMHSAWTVGFASSESTSGTLSRPPTDGQTISQSSNGFEF